MKVTRETVHVSDDTCRIAMLENRTYGSDDSAEKLTRYIYSNHLQSASLELDEHAAVISYEEYHPYGTTAFKYQDDGVKATAKRYRYTGKERDDESGLYYHGARYYVPWLCRWISVDPINSEWYNLLKGRQDRNLKRSLTELTASPYEYCYDNPIRFTDPTGEQPPVIVEAEPIRIERNGPPIGSTVPRRAGQAPANQLDHPGGDPSWDINQTGGNAAVSEWIKQKIVAWWNSGEVKPLTPQGVANMRQAQKNSGAEHGIFPIPSIISKKYDYLNSATKSQETTPPEKITTDVNKLSAQERDAIASRVMSGKGTANDRILFGQIILQNLSILKTGGTISILNGKGILTVDIKNGMLSGSFKEGDQTVLFDAKIQIKGKNIDFLKVGIYGEKGFGTTDAQGTVGFPAFRKLIVEIENLAKNAGFESGSIEYERRRPDGSTLKDSKSRIIPLNLK